MNHLKNIRRYSDDQARGLAGVLATLAVFWIISRMHFNLSSGYHSKLRVSEILCLIRLDTVLCRHASPDAALLNDLVRPFFSHRMISRSVDSNCRLCANYRSPIMFQIFKVRRPYCDYCFDEVTSTNFSVKTPFICLNSGQVPHIKINHGYAQVCGYTANDSISVCPIVRQNCA